MSKPTIASLSLTIAEQAIRIAALEERLERLASWANAQRASQRKAPAARTTVYPHNVGNPWYSRSKQAWFQTVQVSANVRTSRPVEAPAGSEPTPAPAAEAPAAEVSESDLDGVQI